MNIRIFIMCSMILLAKNYCLAMQSKGKNLKKWPITKQELASQYNIMLLQGKKSSDYIENFFYTSPLDLTSTTRINFRANYNTGDITLLSEIKKNRQEKTYRQCGKMLVVLKFKLTKSGFCSVTDLVFSNQQVPKPEMRKKKNYLKKVLQDFSGYRTMIEQKYPNFSKIID